MIFDGCNRISLCDCRRALLCWRNHNIAISDVVIFASLKIDWSRQLLVAIQRASRDARNLLLINNRRPVLDYRDRPSLQSDVKALPFTRLARHLRLRRDETVDSARMTVSYTHLTLPTNREV